MPEKLIVRLPNWLGDTVMAVPTVRALRDSFPDGRLVLAGEYTAGPFAALMEGALRSGARAAAQLLATG